MEILNKIISYDDDGIKYYEIVNNKSKKWLIPVNNIKIGFELYQPTALKGKLLKKFFCLIHKNIFLKKMLKIKEKKNILNNELKNFFDKKFGKSYDLSFFGGTPSVHQKAIIQISINKKILAYCKVSDRIEIKKIFDKEFDNLKYLKEYGINNIPEPIENNEENGIYYMCQSSVKKNKSNTINKLNKKHIQFLIEMYKKTQRYIKFEETDYYIMLQKIKKLNIRNIKDKKLILKSVEIIEKIYNEKYVDFCFYHGDFTPWNITFEKNKLFLFDFEYSKKTYPKYLDLMHFYLQTEIFIKKNNINKILKEFEDIKNKLNYLNIDMDIYFIMYLLEVLELYHSRTENETEDEKINNKLRIELLRRIIEKYD